MLVLLSGVISTGKHLITRQLIDAHNTFGDANFSLDLSRLDPGAVKDAEGSKSTIQTVTADSSITDYNAGSDALANLIQIEYDYLQYEVASRLGHQFSSPGYDATTARLTLPEGKTATVPWRDAINEYDGITSDVTIESVVNDYNSSSIRPYVLNGIFGKPFIDEMKSQLGTENVLVYNILRNPSVVFALTSNERTDADVGSREQERLYTSLLQAALIKDVEGVVNIKFEDIIANQEFIYDGSNVGVYSGWGIDNGLLTTYERENVIPSIPVTEEELSSFNNSIQSLSIDDLETNSESNIDSDLSDQVGTWNILTELGYDPKTLAQITTS